MRLLSLLFTTGLIIALTSCNQPVADPPEESGVQANATEFYQIKTYTFSSVKQMLATDVYLGSAYLPALKRIGIDQVGVFKPIENENDSTWKTYLLIPFSSMDEFLNLDAKLLQDQGHLSAGAAYLDASHEEKPYERIESTILKAFADMPKMKTPNLDSDTWTDRVYELRSYEGPTEEYYRRKVDMFNAGGEIKLFDRLGFNAVFYAEVISGSKMPNLMYMTTFNDMATRDSLWDEFRVAPEWMKLKEIEKYKNTVSHADIHLLYPTEYSDY